MTPPPYLYKYRAINKYTSDIFCRRVLWFSRPESFNDPYDCAPVCQTETDEQGYREYLRSALPRLHPDWTEDELDAKVQSEMEQTWPPDDQQLADLRRKYEERLSAIGVFSASARYDSVVMWSHYADSHRGICLELDPAAFPSNVKWLPVKYQRRRPVINLFRDHLQANRLAAGVKNVEWSYEDEWRLTPEPAEASASFPLEVTLPDDAIASVILGARIDESNRQRVTDWCDLLPKPPVMYEAFLDETDFKISRRVV